MRLSGPCEPALPQGGGGDDLGRAHEAGAAVGGGERELVDRAELAREGLPELAERRVVGHHDEPGVRVGDAGGLLQRGQDEAGRRVGVGALVLGDLRGPAVPQRLGQHPLRVLVQGAEGVGLPVGSLEGQAEALRLADHADGRQPAAGLLEVEHGHLDRGRPEVAVAAPEPEPVEPAGLELRAGRHGSRLLGEPARRHDARQHRQDRHLSRTHPRASKDQPSTVGGALPVPLSVSCHGVIWRGLAKPVCSSFVVPDTSTASAQVT